MAGALRLHVACGIGRLTSFFVIFDDFMKTKKMRDVRTIILAAVSRRDLCYVSENKGFRFAKNKLIHADSSFIAAGAEHTFAS